MTKKDQLYEGKAKKVFNTDDPSLLIVSYKDDQVSADRTQTITLPLNALVPNPSAHSRARVVISAVGQEENVLVNNEFTIFFGNGQPLQILEQPADATVQEGEDVSFRVKVKDGKPPYTYQWQIWDPKHEKWVDLPGFTEPTLSRKDIEKKWDGARFRCVVTDGKGTQIVSQEVTLTVRDGVDTGDHSNLPLYLVVVLIGLALLWWTRRRMRA